VSVCAWHDEAVVGGEEGAVHGVGYGAYFVFGVVGAQGFVGEGVELAYCEVGEGVSVFC